MQRQGGGHLVRACAEHDADGVDVVGALHRVDRVLQQRHAVELGELLGSRRSAAPPPPRARVRRSRSSRERALQQRGELLEGDERVAVEEGVDVGQRGGHPAGERLVAGARAAAG